jgi:hypothetical protein
MFTLNSQPSIAQQTLPTMTIALLNWAWVFSYWKLQPAPPAEVVFKGQRRISMTSQSPPKKMEKECYIV